jgi:LysM repeat protein
MPQQNWMQRARFLTQALILSGTLNIGFLSTSIYFALRDKQQTLTYEVPIQVKKQFNNEEVLRSYSQLSFQELILRLENKELMEEGCVRRDLALASLAAFHYFPVEKALGGLPLQKRVFSFHRVQGSEETQVTVFVGLKDEHFAALVQFAKTERWPLTSQGLFLSLMQSSFPWDPTLLEAFYCTTEFHSFYSLMQRYVPDIPKPFVVSMLKEGSWELLHTFSEKLRLLQSYDLETYRECLVSYGLGASSRIAADLLWRYEREYVYKRFDDDQIMAFLELQKPYKDRAELLAKELLTSLRSDRVRHKAVDVLYALVEEQPPAIYEYDSIVARFYPEKAQPVQIQQSAQVVDLQYVAENSKPKKTIHVVQLGDSLWKIARKYKVSIDSILKINNLESDRLRLGKELEIPSSQNKE